MIRFIGVYDYTVLLTYISLFCSIFGITKAVGGDFNTAVFCLAMSGLCDAFDSSARDTPAARPRWPAAGWGFPRY